MITNLPTKWYRSSKRFSWVLPTKWRQKPAGDSHGMYLHHCHPCIINESLLLRITGHFLAIVCDIVVLQSHVALQSLYYSHQKQTHILVVAPYGPQGCKYRSWLAAQLNIQHPCRILPLEQRFSLRPYEFCCVTARWSLFAKCCTNTEYCTDVL